MDDRTYRQDFHHFSEGRPSVPVYQTVDSLAVPPTKRYDYWLRSNICGLEVSRPNDKQKRDFLAEVTSLATPNSELHYARADSYEGSRTPRHIRADESDALSLLYVLDGRVDMQYGREPDIVARAGQFVAYDASCPNRIRLSDRHSLIEVSVSRERLSASLPRATLAPFLICEALNHSRLAKLLGAHLAAFPQHVGMLNPSERLALLDTSEAFAITTIENALTSAYGDRRTHHTGLFAAAQRHIRQHLGRQDLDADDIALAIGCSRATLYRVFSHHQSSVAGYIRELRLQQLMALLQQPERKEKIAELAARCGLFDTSNLNRLFKRRFDASPNEIRASHQSVRVGFPSVIQK